MYTDSTTPERGPQRQGVSVWEGLGGKEYAPHDLTRARYAVARAQHMLPTLSAFGLTCGHTVESRPGQKPSKRGSDFEEALCCASCVEADEAPPPDPLEVEWAIRFLERLLAWGTRPQPVRGESYSSRPRPDHWSSYALKHAAEQWSKANDGVPYVSNGALITAAVHLQIPLLSVDCPNVLYELPDPDLFKVFEVEAAVLEKERVFDLFWPGQEGRWVRAEWGGLIRVVPSPGEIDERAVRRRCGEAAWQRAMNVRDALLEAERVLFN